MTRKSKEELNQICEKYNVDRLWSYSRVSSFDQCKLGYKLNYIDKVKKVESGAYGWFGNLCHEILQDHLENKITYDEMIMKFITETEAYKISGAEVNGLPVGKFPGTNGSTSEQNRDKLFSALEHYFIHADIPKYKKISVEPFILAKFGNEYLQGYIDVFYTNEDGKYIILDLKTSSMSEFTGAKLYKKAVQLYLYAIAVHQLKKIPVGDIIIRYDMMKFVTITYPLKKPNKKGEIHATTRGERHKWVEKIATKLEKDLVKDFCFDKADAIELVAQAMSENNLDCMPQRLKDKYVISNHYIDIHLDKDTLKEQYLNFKNKLKEIREFEKCVPDKIRGPIEPSEEFFCTNLCDTKHECSWYKKLKDDKEQADIFADCHEQNIFDESDPFGGTLTVDSNSTGEINLEEDEDEFFENF